MVEYPNLFDALPNEVFQLIFKDVADCKSLVRCMAVSKTFKEQSSRVTSLSIACPGQFLTYDQKLKQIYAIVKEFQFLESLIVRVGQPKDGPPSWARCMRYAEIGASVQKFIFMAAKSGDFSKFDHALGGGKEFNGNSCEHEEKRHIFSNVNSNFLMEQSHNILNSRAHDNYINENTFHRPEQELEDPRERINSNIAFHCETNELINEPMQEQEVVFNFDPQSSIPTMNETNNHVILQDANQLHNGFQNNTMNILGPGSTTINRFYHETHVFEHLNPQFNNLPNFNLRQVIAPSNDVLKRMVAVIVFAIIQGLDEFRDCLPEFLASFTKLKRFLLIDMVESVTVHMRDSHIEEIRLQQIQDKKREHQKERYENQRTISNQTKTKIIEKNDKHESNNSDSIGMQSQPQNNRQQGFNIKENRLMSKCDINNATNSRDKLLLDSQIPKYKYNCGIKVDDSLKCIKQNLTRENLDSTKLQEQYIFDKNKSYKMNSTTSNEIITSSNNDLANEPHMHTKLFSNSSLENNFPLTINASHTISSIGLVKCKRCQNLNALGRIGPCWTCMNKNPVKNSFEQKKDKNLEDLKSTQIFHSYSSNVFNNGLSPKETPTNNESLVGFLNTNKNIPSSCSTTFNNLYGIQNVNDLSNLSNLLFSDIPRRIIISNKTLQNKQTLEQNPLLQVSSTSSFISLPNIECNSKISLESSTSYSSNEPNYKSTTGLKLNFEARNELQTSKKSVVHSSPQWSITNLQVFPSYDQDVEETRYMNNCEFGRSWSLDSLKTLKGKEEREVILSTKRKQIAEKVQNLVASHLQTNYKNIRKTSMINVSKGNKLKEKIDDINTSEVIFSSQNRDLLSEAEMESKYLFTRNPHTNAIKRREPNGSLQIGNFHSRDENCCILQKNIIQGKNIPSTSTRYDQNELESMEIQRVETFLDAHSSRESQNLNSLKIENVSLWIKGTNLKLESTDVSNSKTHRFTKSKDKQIVNGSSNRVIIEHNVSTNNNMNHFQNKNATNTSPNSSTEMVECGLNMCQASTSMESQCPYVPPERIAEKLNNQEGISKHVQERGSKSQRPMEDGHLRRRDCSSEHQQSAGDMRTEREQQLQDEAVQFGVLGFEERIGEQETWQETWRERVGRRVRAMPCENHGENEREREARRERLQEGVCKRQQDIEREALFFDISFWTAEQISTYGCCLSDVSMCIATRASKPLTSLELDILSKAALAGPLLAATVTYVNKQVGSQNL